MRANIELRLKKLDERVDRLTKTWKDCRQANREMESTLNLIRKSDARAIKMWQAAHPGKELVWPDRGKMIFWLLEQLEKQ